MNLGDYLILSLECDECGEKSTAIMGLSMYQAAQDFTEDGWILRKGEVLCPACAEDEDAPEPGGNEKR